LLAKGIYIFIPSWVVWTTLLIVAVGVCALLWWLYRDKV
jgi:hypothetical protein